MYTLSLSRIHYYTISVPSQFENCVIKMYWKRVKHTSYIWLQVKALMHNCQSKNAHLFLLHLSIGDSTTPSFTWNNFSPVHRGNTHPIPLFNLIFNNSHLNVHVLPNKIDFFFSYFFTLHSISFSFFYAAKKISFLIKLTGSSQEVANGPVHTAAPCHHPS